MDAEKQAAHLARYSEDHDFLRRVGIALEFEAKRRRDAGEAPLTNADAAALIAALPA